MIHVEYIALSSKNLLFILHGTLYIRLLQCLRLYTPLQIDAENLEALICRQENHGEFM